MRIQKDREKSPPLLHGSAEDQPYQGVGLSLSLLEHKQDTALHWPRTGKDRAEGTGWF